MIRWLIAASRSSELRFWRRLGITLVALAVWRLGSALPVPGLSPEVVARCLAPVTASPLSSPLSITQIVSGGGFLRVSVFALGLMPYLFGRSVVALRRSVRADRRSVGLVAMGFATALAVLLVWLGWTGRLYSDDSCGSVFLRDARLPVDAYLPVPSIAIVAVVLMVTGSLVVKRLCELIDDHGIGEGLPLLFFVSVGSQFVRPAIRVVQDLGWAWLGAVAGMFVVSWLLTVTVEQAQRRIPVQYAKRQIGRRMYGGTSTYIPLKVNQAGSEPAGMALAMLGLGQAVVASFQGSHSRIIDFLLGEQSLSRASWLTVILFVPLVVFFAYLLVGIRFNPNEMADNMKRYGGFVPGIRPGRPTAEYLGFMLSRVAPIGIVFLLVVTAVPMALAAFVPEHLEALRAFPFSGEAALFMGMYALESVKQLEGEMMRRGFEGFLR